MAYLQQNNQNDPNNQSGTSLTGGASLSGGSGIAGAGTPSNTNGSSQGNQFSNLQKLMNLNQNAPNTAAKVNQNVQQGQQTQQNNISQATQGIGQSYNYNQGDMTNKIQNNDFSGLQQQLNTTYQGPQAGTVSVGPQNLGQIDQQTTALGSKPGQQALLAQQYGRNDYSSGQQKLDNFLQGRNSQFQQDAAQARNQGKQLDESTANQNQALNQKAATTAQQTAQGVNNLKQGLGSTVQGYQTDAEKAADVANQADQKLQAQIAAQQNGIAGGTADTNVLQNLGFDPNGYTYGVDLGKYIGYQGGPANVNNVMSTDTYNRFKNINQMLGNDVSGYKDDLAGTYKQGQETYDKTGLQDALTKGQQAYTSSFAPQTGGLNAAKDINRLANGQVTDAERQQYMSDPSIQGVINQYKGFGQTPDPHMFDQAIAQMIIQKNYPGASTNGTTRTDWAAGNLQSAQKAYDQAKQTADSQYLKKVGVNNG